MSKKRQLFTIGREFDHQHGIIYLYPFVEQGYETFECKVRWQTTITDEEPYWYGCHLQTEYQGVENPWQLKEFTRIAKILFGTEQRLPKTPEDAVQLLSAKGFKHAVHDNRLGERIPVDDVLPLDWKSYHAVDRESFGRGYITNVVASSEHEAERKLFKKMAEMSPSYLERWILGGKVIEESDSSRHFNQPPQEHTLDLGVMLSIRPIDQVTA
jgi:hypothetical protein